MAARKHNIECPHCRKQFEFTPPVKKKEQKKSSIVFTASVKWFLGEHRPDFIFDGIQGKALNLLLKKIETTLRSKKDKVYTEEYHIQAFTIFVQCLPEYAKQRDFLYWNSKYNDLLSQMRTGRTPQDNGFNKKNSGDRYADSAYRS
jgi:hypothetical protein